MELNSTRLSQSAFEWTRTKSFSHNALLKVSDTLEMNEAGKFLEVSVLDHIISKQLPIGGVNVL